MIIIKRRKKDKKIQIRIGKREKDIIKAIGLGTLVVASFALPNLPLALKSFFKRQGRVKFEVYLQQLRDKGIIYLGGDKIRLTNKGLQLQKIIKTEETNLKKPRKWDGYWRLISYDVPEVDKRDRDYFRQTIEKWGFRKVQKSLWAYPYDCKEEIAVLADGLNISQYVMCMTTDEMPNEDKWEEYFEL